MESGEAVRVCEFDSCGLPRICEMGETHSDGWIQGSFRVCAKIVALATKQVRRNYPMSDPTTDRETIVRFEPVFPVDMSQVKDGNPAGGTVNFVARDADGNIAEVGTLDWQDGPVDPQKGGNGVTVESLLEACVRRLEFYNTAAEGKYRCRENSLAITEIQAALGWLNQRRWDRFKRGVLNSHQV